MHIERKTREQIECEVREGLRARGVPVRDDVIDGPPMFDAFHEACIPYIVDDIDRLWRSLRVLVQADGSVDMRFDLSDVHADPYVDLGGES